MVWTILHVEYTPQNHLSPSLVLSRTRFSTCTRGHGSFDCKLFVACAIFGSRLDYCNALLAVMSWSNLDKLQHVQNCLARVVRSASRRDHIKPVLTDLRWLPILARISFKIAKLVHKVRTSHQHHTLRTSSTTTDRRGHFVPDRWLSSRSRQWGRQLVDNVFIASKQLSPTPSGTVISSHRTHAIPSVYSQRARHCSSARLGRSLFLGWRQATV